MNRLTGVLLKDIIFSFFIFCFTLDKYMIRCIHTSLFENFNVQECAQSRRTFCATIKFTMCL